MQGVDVLYETMNRLSFSNILFIVTNIYQDRALSKKNPCLRTLYQQNHGDDWENVVDNDTVAIYTHYQNHKTFFHKNLCKLNLPVLLTGSKEDNLCPVNFLNHPNLQAANASGRKHPLSPPLKESKFLFGEL